MKKLLGVLGAVGMVATSASTVVSCGNKGETDYKLDLTSKDYDTLDEVKDYIISQNSDIKKVLFMSDVKFADALFNAKDENSQDATDAMLDSAYFEAAHRDGIISNLTTFAYTGIGTDKCISYGEITNSAK
jgi:hypothetical protein